MLYPTIPQNRIVNDGLILYLDAGIKGSYSGSGTTWIDLAQNNNGTFVNEVGYDDANGGTLTFDGINDYVLLPLDFFPYPSLTTFTISLWFRSSQATGGTLFGQQNTLTETSAWVPVIYLKSDGSIRVEPFWTGGYNSISSYSGLNDNTWHNVVTTFNSGINQLYIDGFYVIQLTGLTLTPYSPNYYYLVGAGRSLGRDLGGDYFDGDISSFKFYNKALTPHEIKQNFESTRGRFNV